MNATIHKDRTNNFGNISDNDVQHHFKILLKFLFDEFMVDDVFKVRRWVVQQEEKQHKESSSENEQSLGGSQRDVVTRRWRVQKTVLAKLKPHKLKRKETGSSCYYKRCILERVLFLLLDAGAHRENLLCNLPIVLSWYCTNPSRKKALWSVFIGIYYKNNDDDPTYREGDDFRDFICSEYFANEEEEALTSTRPLFRYLHFEKSDRVNMGILLGFFDAEFFRFRQNQYNLTDPDERTILKEVVKVLLGAGARRKHVTVSFLSVLRLYSKNPDVRADLLSIAMDCLSRSRPRIMVCENRPVSSRTL